MFRGCTTQDSPFYLFLPITNWFTRGSKQGKNNTKTQNMKGTVIWGRNISAQTRYLTFFILNHYPITVTVCPKDSHANQRISRLTLNADLRDFLFDPFQDFALDHKVLLKKKLLCGYRAPKSEKIQKNVQVGPGGMRKSDLWNDLQEIKDIINRPLTVFFKCWLFYSIDIIKINIQIAMDAFDDLNQHNCFLPSFSEDSVQYDSQYALFYPNQAQSLRIRLQTFYNPTSPEKDNDMVGKEEEEAIIISRWSTLSNISIQSQSFDINSDIQQNIQNKQEMSQPDEEGHQSNEQRLNQYSLGHIDSLNFSHWSIFGSSRKYQRSKKGKGSKKLTELQAIAKRMKSFKGKRLNTTYAKRFDQQLSKKFRALLPKDQGRKDITPSALRNIIKNRKNGDNFKVFSSFIEKCESQRHWYAYLSMWNSEKETDWEKELNQ